ncbi:CO/xanthine dehydrogenase FAD-binding subunit [Nocardioides zeae]|uniref:CO/xanthine dehydrogenase FAD-binding subunit n=1 Tax=Nocardioides zeae TaxID=1457234 RepID=A0ACC6IKD8_9ACTN|nr:FAD binding domain-containing protein [Nocardioides zeae]MDR6175374.1 CO/xanthine dehydrogenase FAD-binding subunit [Nocardioides zeae]MDR6211135.1 CO/xanthine dehydrogenase FAD-binding subunit [Nocardioides zeae]
MDLAELRGVRVPRTLDEAWLQPGESWLAGGSWLYSTPQPHLGGLVDLTGLGWSAVEPIPAPTPEPHSDEPGPDEPGLRIGATCTVAALLAATAPWVADPRRASVAALARRCADAFLMSFKVQEVATVGGNVCLGLPAGAMTSLAVALDARATLLTADGGARVVPVADLVTGPGRTDRRPDELLRGLEVDAGALAATYAVRTLSLTPVGRSAAVVIGRLDAPSGACTVSVTAATDRPVVLRFGALPGVDELAAAVAGIAEERWYDDPHGAPDWRAHLAGVLAREVLDELHAGTREAAA